MFARHQHARIDRGLGDRNHPRPRKADGHVLVPAFAVSANSSPEQVESYLAAGFDGCIAKPFTIAALQDALERLASEPFNLVLMDMQMPGIGGPDTTRALRRAGHRLPVIGVAASASTEDRDICKAARMEGFLPWPVTLLRLADTIAEVIPHSAKPAPPPPASHIAPNPQMEDLRTSLGDEMVKTLLDQSASSLIEPNLFCLRPWNPPTKPGSMRGFIRSKGSR